ncbi:MAG: hypothetical protein SGILL_010513, partial [Bacillariaceae sp.]
MSDPDRVGARIPGPSLMRLIQQERYTEALEHFRERPQDASYKNAAGHTALHILCAKYDPQPEIMLQFIGEILSLRPELVDIPDETGWTPMHHAAYFKNDQPLLLLIEAYPLAVSRPAPRNVGGHTSFHLCCETTGSWNALKAMLEVDPSLATLSDVR